MLTIPDCTSLRRRKGNSVVNLSWFVNSRECHGLGLGHGWRVMRVTGQLNDWSSGSRVTKCDPLSALLWRGILAGKDYRLKTRGLCLSRTGNWASRRGGGLPSAQLAWGWIPTTSLPVCIPSLDSPPEVTTDFNQHPVPVDTEENFNLVRLKSKQRMLLKKSGLTSEQSSRFRLFEYYIL